MKGEPAVNPFTPVVESHRYLSNQSSKMLDNSIDDFLYSMESSPGFSQSLARVKDQNIFYVSNRGKSSAGGGVNEAIGPSPKNFAASVIWFVPRRVTESTKPLVLMYIILKEAKQLYQVLHLSCCAHFYQCMFVTSGVLLVAAVIRLNI